MYGCATWSPTLRYERRLRVFENRVLRGIFGPKRGEGRGELRNLHNKEPNNLYYSPNIIWAIQSRRMWWAGDVARMERVEVFTWFWWGNLRGKNHLEDPCVEGRIILKWIFRKWDVRVWTQPMFLRIGTGGGHLWIRKWTFGFNKMWGISWLRTDYLLKKDSSPWSK